MSSEGHETVACHARQTSAELVELPPKLLRKLSAFNPASASAVAATAPKSPSSVFSSEHEAASSSSMTEHDKRASHATFGSTSGSPDKPVPASRRSRRWSALGSVEESSSTAFSESYFPSPALALPLAAMAEPPRTPPRKARPVSLSSTPSRAPESELAIHAQLLRSSSVNASRIVPRPPPPPPSTGMPAGLGGRGVERNKSLKRDGSKLDHVLGHGAETARVILEIERRREEEKKPIETTPLPPPPTRKHQHTISHSASSLQDLERPRAGSLDSLSSLHPSLNDSISTLTNLLPAVPPRSTPTTLSTTKDLNATQRAQLLRRARKLEQVLGETLREAQVGEHIVEPAATGTTVDRHAWPEAAVAVAVPEWDKEDVVPQRASESGNPRPSLQTSMMDPFGSASASATSRFGGRAVAALTRRVRGQRQRSKSDEADGLEIFVAREKVTVVRRDRLAFDDLHEQSTLNRAKAREVESVPVSPVSVMTCSTTSPPRDEVAYDSDEEAKRERRVRLAKLHRLLGTTIPPAMVPAVSRGRGSTPIAERPPPLPSPLESTTTSSFISFDDRSRRSQSPDWATKLIGATTRKTCSPSTEEAEMSLSSIVCLDRMSEKEKQVARRRATKLEHVFGTLPPQGMFVTSSQDSVHAVGPSANCGHARSASVATFDTYQQSLQGLLYLIENNHDELGRIIDELGDRDRDQDLSRTSSQTHSPMSPSPTSPNSLLEDSGPESFAARRKRAGKLSHFFGEARVGQEQQAPRKSRKEMFEGMLGDVWKGAQADASTGGIGREELESLSSLMGALRKRRATLRVWEEL